MTAVEITDTTVSESVTVTRRGGPRATVCPHCHHHNVKVIEVKVYATGTIERRCKCRHPKCYKTFRTLEILIDGNAQRSMLVLSKHMSKLVDGLLPRLRQLTAELDSIGKYATQMVRSSTELLKEGEGSEISN